VDMLHDIDYMRWRPFQNDITSLKWSWFVNDTVCSREIRFVYHTYTRGITLVLS